MLEISGLCVNYGVVSAVRDVDLRVGDRELVALVGANGAGKSSTLRAVSGAVGIRAGTIVFDGERIDRMTPDLIAGRGLVHVPEGRQLFGDMTVRENLELGAYLPRARRRRHESMGEVLDLLPRLKERLGQRAGSLSGGEQQMVAIGRGLMARPRFLIMDEPSLGLAPIYVNNLFETIVAIRATETPILLVEQNVHRALELSNRGYVMQTGSIVMSGPSGELLRSQDLAAAYLGIEQQA